MMTWIRGIRRWGGRSLSRGLIISLLMVTTFSIAVGCAANSSPTPAPAPPVRSAAPSTDLAVGTNLTGIADWSTQLPFLDAMKSSRRWITKCVETDPGCTGQWSTDEGDQLALDEHGWPTSLPAPEDPPIFTRVGTLMFREINGRYPGGQYVVLYDGEGTLDYGFDARKDVAASRPGRDVITVTPSHDGILLLLTATDPNQTGNYLRNIHVVPAAAETTFKTDIFNPLMLERLEPFQSLRLMDWMRTNNSTVSEWSDRPQIDDYSYSLKGVPLEIMVELAERLEEDVWFCMPHSATDDYIRNFAEFVKAELDPSLKIYVELSNEVWNWMFDQAHYALEQGKTRWNQEGDVFMQWYGMRTAQMADIWAEVFADERDRIVLVMGTQTSWRGLERAALDCPLWVAEGHSPCYQHVDAYTITGYFTGGMVFQNNIATVERWLDEGRDSAIEKAFTQLSEGGLLEAGDHDGSVPGIRELFDYHAAIAQERGLSLLVYEGGQHLALPDHERLTEFFIELNRRPEMYDIYTQLLSEWRDAGGSLFMNFADFGIPSRWGSWGVLEHVADEESPRYNALVDFIQTHS
jgi:hypothetical protein